METQLKTSLFSPHGMKGHEITNRFVMAPMTRSRAVGALPNDLMASYYAQRASAGLIVSEGTAPSPNALGYARIPGIYNDQQVKGWKKITDAVHHKGSRIFLQLMHTGRIAHPANLPANAEVLAPSAVRADGDMWTDTSGMQPLPVPREMNLTDIENALSEFVKAAENAVEAGFDGVEIHAANGYLPGQFLNPHSNKRTDHYGGSTENRSRFVLELSSAVAGAIGKEKTGIRLSPYGTFNSMAAYEETFDTYDYLAGELDKLDIVYIHLVESAARSHDEGLRLLEKIRENFSNTLILNGGYTGATAAAALEEGKADLISFGTPFISNPDLPERIKKGAPLNDANAATFYSADEKGYIDYPLLQA